MNIQKEFESDELRFYLYIFIKIQERFISLNFQKYKYAPIKICKLVKSRHIGLGNVPSLGHAKSSSLK